MEFTDSASVPRPSDHMSSPTISRQDREVLTKSAKAGMRNAYAPRSGFPVGAAVLTFHGNVYQGCNVESVISGLGTCAERCAIDHAVAHGEYCFRAMLVTSRLENPIRPCGACLQYINEFAQIGKDDIVIFMVGATGKVARSSIWEMLPGGFGPKDLGLDLSRYVKNNSEGLSED